MMKPSSHQRYSYFYQSLLVNVTLPFRCLWYGFIIMLCHLQPPPHLLLVQNYKLSILLPGYLRGISGKKAPSEASLSVFNMEVLPYLVKHRKQNSLDPPGCHQTPAWRMFLLLDTSPGFTTRPFVFFSDRDELSGPSCCRAMRVSSWSWSASAWGNLGQFTSVWRGWMAACTPSNALADP